MLRIRFQARFSHIVAPDSFQSLESCNAGIENALKLRINCDSANLRVTELWSSGGPPDPSQGCPVAPSYANLSGILNLRPRRKTARSLANRMPLIFRDTSAIWYTCPSILRHHPKAQLLPQAPLDETESITLTNVRIFDGNRLKAPSTVVISGGLIAPVLESTHANTTIDGAGGFLIPGLIDTHVHVHDLEDLVALAKHGVTTALDMGTKSLEFFPSGSLRGAPGVADIRNPGLPATSADSRHGKSPHFPKHSLVSGVEDTARFLSERVAEGADYIKIMIDTPGPDQATLNALVARRASMGS
jgi:hypothetical protein